MLKKTITYPDLDGNPVTEDFYFNLSKAEIAEMELSHEGGFKSYLERLIEKQDGGEIVAAFKNIIMSAVGRRSEDGRRFVKSPEITNEFLQTEAYSQLFMALVTDPDAAVAFVKGIVPSDLAEAVKDISPSEKLAEPPKDETPAYIKEDREPTQAELARMSQEELREAFRRRQGRESE